MLIMKKTARGNCRISTVLGSGYSAAPSGSNPRIGEKRISVVNGDFGWIANFIWGIADDVLRDLYVRGKYRDVILPMTVLRRLDAVLEPTKKAVLDTKANLDKAKITQSGCGAARSFGARILQHLEVFAARLAQSRKPATIEGRLRSLSRRVLAECAGDP